MSSTNVTRYMITIDHKATGLTPVNELNNEMTRAGFSLTLTDEDGKLHEPGPGIWTLTSTLNAQEVEALARGLGKLALGQEPDVRVVTQEEWLKEQQ
ncbi:type V toxin-antitoxin system endoribonuclease antitoxin GhoS [Enterobacteriaceae bacterium 4M9]|nr:type V toxin-antitoxin system endoribonuclease antitoxin GhoS [Enterobacteriaceae bacterium 4M9]